MNILLTGASSFTGFWFASVFEARGHSVYATFQGSEQDYAGIRKKRIAALPNSVVRLWNTAQGSENLLKTVSSVEQWDLLCLHGAFVTGYKERTFDFALAVKNNTAGLPLLLETMASRGMKRVLVTGSVFEADEGAGEEPLRAFSPYGLSKTLTWQCQKYWAEVVGLHLGKFVIANPFGPYEEPRFTAYLMKTWFSGKTAEVRTPSYIRDNIHVDRLACHYADFALSLRDARGVSNCAPMGYVESQGAFALRFASAMRDRLGLPCNVTIGQQTDFSEPLVRVNTQAIELNESRWREAAAWDMLADYYRAEYSSASMTEKAKAVLL
jgi:UDP-glucose 4-epimerase